MKAVVFTDGAARGTPGPASAGAIVYDEGGAVLARAGLALGDATNNVAEYEGVLLGLREARRLGADDVALYSDSRVIVEQIAGSYACNAEHLRPLRDQARELSATFARLSIEYVPREQNREADKITQEVLKGTFRADAAPADREIAVTFTVRVVMDPRTSKTRLAAGATNKELRRELGDRVAAALPRAIVVGDSIEIKRHPGT